MSGHEPRLRLIPANRSQLCPDSERADPRPALGRRRRPPPGIRRRRWRARRRRQRRGCGRCGRPHARRRPLRHGQRGRRGADPRASRGNAPDMAGRRRGSVSTPVDRRVLQRAARRTDRARSGPNGGAGGARCVVHGAGPVGDDVVRRRRVGRHDVRRARICHLGIQRLPDGSERSEVRAVADLRRPLSRGRPRATRGRDPGAGRARRDPAPHDAGGVERRRVARGRHPRRA
jgi:hypothetical protein